MLEPDFKLTHYQHSHGHHCYFASCPLEACKKAQRDAERYGFTKDGEIAQPESKKLPWEGI